MLQRTTERQDIADFLRTRDIFPTSQRVVIARVLLEQQRHLTAEEIFRLVNRTDAHVSKATVYNTLGLFAEKGIVREVVADPGRVVYDPNTAPHHHFYDAASGELTDIDATDVQVSGLPPLPDGAELQGVDIIVRIRRPQNSR